MATPPALILAAGFLFNLGQGVLRPSLPRLLRHVFDANYRMVNLIPVVLGAGSRPSPRRPTRSSTTGRRGRAVSLLLNVETLGMLVGPLVMGVLACALAESCRAHRGPAT